MSDCMTRDWASDKQGLFSSVAPFTGLAAGGSALGGLSFGSVARADGGEGCFSVCSVVYALYLRRWIFVVCVHVVCCAVVCYGALSAAAVFQ
jgi:hypothetical protein